MRREENINNPKDIFIMRRTFFNFLMIAVMAVSTILGTLSCREKPGPAPEANEFKLGTDTVTIARGGGEGEISYAVKNPVEGLLPVAATEEEWVNSFEVSEEDGIIRFTVDSCESGDAREALISVVYDTMKTSFIVKQLPKDPEIACEILSTKSVSFVIRTTPIDGSMTYYTGLMEKKNFDTFQSDEDVYKYDLEYFQTLADQGGVSLSRVIKGHIKYGQITRQGNKLNPGTEYVTYSYGLNAEGEPLTEVYSKSTVTKEFDTDDNTEFTLKVDINGVDLSYWVEPSDLQKHYIQYVSQEENETEDLARIRMQAYIDSYTFAVMYGPAGFDGKIEDLIEGFTPRGVQHFTVELAKPNTPTKIYTWALTPQGQICSIPTTKEFSSGDVPASDLTVEINVEEINVRDAMINTRCNQDADAYILLIGKTADYEGMTSEEIVDKIISDQGKNISKAMYRGNVRGPFKSLIRNTDYSLFAFGYKSGVVTTNLFRTDFTTLDEEMSDVICTIDVSKYFDGDEVAAKDPNLSWTTGLVVVPVTAVTTGNPVEYMYHIWSAEWADESKVHDDEIISWLMNGGVKDPTMTFYTAFDDPRCAIAVAKAEDGRYGDVYRFPITFTKEGCAPIDEFEPQKISQCIMIPKSKELFGLDFGKITAPLAIE